jgi:hypothetical protein
MHLNMHLALAESIQQSVQRFAGAVGSGGSGPRCSLDPSIDSKNALHKPNLILPTFDPTASRAAGHPVVRFPEQLRMHPALGELGLPELMGEINEAAQLEDRSVAEPILVTTDGIILGGFGRWRLALLKGIREVHCIEYAIGEEDAIQFILNHCKPQQGWNAFVRIQLALTLEPTFQRRALDHMKAGGKYKGSSKLTEPERLDVRSEIAVAAGACVGNVTKVKQLLATACGDLQDALRNGELRIHRAWLWRDMSAENQRRALMAYRSDKGVKKTIRRLVSKHKPKDPVLVEGLELAGLARRLSRLQSPQLDSVTVAVINVPGEAVFVTAELLQLLPAQEELLISCVAESR